MEFVNIVIENKFMNYGCYKDFWSIRLCGERILLVI